MQGQRLDRAPEGRPLGQAMRPRIGSCKTVSMSPFRRRLSLEQRLDTIATNVANMNTAGYRADGVSFSTELAKAGDTNVSFAQRRGLHFSRLSGHR